MASKIKAPAKKQEVESAQCSDPHCPNHGTLATRGAVKRGFVRSHKLLQMAVVEIPLLTKVRKYERFAKRRSRIHAHVPGCIKIKVGDTVEVAECRKISKTKSFVVTKVVGAASLKGVE